MSTQPVAAATALANVVVYDNDQPKYELTAQEICFPIKFNWGASEIVIYFHCDAQYRAYEVKEFLDDLTARFKASEVTTGRELVLGSEKGCEAFVDKHVLGASGPFLEGEWFGADATRAWLTDNGFKARLFREGYDNLFADEDETPAKLTLSRAVNNVMKFRRVLYCPTRKTFQTLHFTHTLVKETEADRIKHRKATKFIDQGQEQRASINWDVIEQLYDHAIHSVDGMLVSGIPCTEANKDAWVKLVPFCDKASVVNRVYSRLAIKNA